MLFLTLEQQKKSLGNNIDTRKRLTVYCQPVFMRESRAFFGRNGNRFNVGSEVHALVRTHANAFVCLLRKIDDKKNDE